MNRINRFFLRLPRPLPILLLSVCAALLCFYGLSARPLFSGDELRVAGIIRSMVLTGNWFLPELNGAPFLEYPPMYYWGGALFMHLFGSGAAAAKAMSAVALFGSILLCFALARRLRFEIGEAFIAALMLGSAVSFFLAGRTCTVDCTLAFFVLLGLHGFYTGMTADRTASQAAGYLLGSLGIAGAIMTKGLLGLALPGAILFFLLGFRDLHERKLHWGTWLMLGVVSAAALIPVLLWSVKLYFYLGAHDFYQIMYANNIGRFTGSQTDHAEPFYYYILRLPQLFQPWLLLIPFGIWSSWRKIRDKIEGETAGIFLLSAFFIPLILFSIASGKRQIYLIPVYPAAILLAAQGLFFLLKKGENRFPEEKISAVMRTTGILLSALIGAASIAGMICRPELRLWGMAPAAAGLAGIVLFLRKSGSGGWLILLLAAALLLPYSEGAFLRDDTLEDLFTKVAELERQGEKVYLLEPPERTRGAAVYYLGKNLPVRNRTRYDGKTREIWIYRLRDKQNPARYSDQHHLVRMPDRTEL